MSAIPEHCNYIEQRMAYAIERMFSARQDCWAYRWGDLAYRLMEAKRNTPTQSREERAGVAASGSQSVAGLSRNSTTQVVVMEQTT